MNPESGGPVAGLLSSTAELAQRGHETEAVTLDPPDAPFLAACPFPVAACGARKVLPKLTYSAAFLEWIRQNAHRFDVAVIHGLWNFASVGGWRALTQAGLPYVLFSHGMMDPWFRQAYPAKHWAKQAFWLLQGRALRDAHRVLFTSEEERRLSEPVFFGYRFRGQVIAYGVAPSADDPASLERSRVAAAAAVPGLAGRPYLLYLSRIHEKKGCDLLIDAFGKVAVTAGDLQLVMAGPDHTGLVPQLRARAEKAGVAGRIHWPGMLTGDAKAGALRSARAFVLPSHQENFGIAVAEALAAGTPVLISDKVNIWREVEAAGAGLVAPDTLEGTEQLLARFLSLDPSASAALQAAARPCYDGNFSVGRAAEDLERVLTEAAATQSGPE
nr:glycosyltransferase [Acidimangrovimonas sediminis]